jgi:hypothetical protein
VPPPGLIIPTIRQFEKQKAKGILMIPAWKSSRFWPVLVPNGKHLFNMATRFMSFSPKLEVGPDVISPTFKKRQPFFVIRINAERAFPCEVGKDFLNCVSRGCADCEN